MFSDLPDTFLARFQRGRFTVRHTNKGQGIISIIQHRRFPRGTTLTIEDRSHAGTLAHLVTIKFPTETVSFLNVYHPPSIDAISSQVLNLAYSVDFTCGDLNSYLQRDQYGRDHQISFWLNSATSLSLCNTMSASNSDKTGPDFVIQSENSDFPSWLASVGDLKSDHFSLAFEIQIESELLQNEVLPPLRKVTKFNYGRITDEFKWSEFELLEAKFRQLPSSARSLSAYTLAKLANENSAKRLVPRDLFVSTVQNLLLSHSERPRQLHAVLADFRQQHCQHWPDFQID